MFINASEILLNKKMGNMDWNENKKYGKWGWSFSAWMPAAFYVDLVWQMAVWFDFYEDYCDFLAGGYIEWFDAINKEMHKKYWKCYLRYFTKQFFTSLNVCPCFWPELKEYNDFELEFQTSHFVHVDAIPKLKWFIHAELIHKEKRMGPEIFW